MTNTLVQDFFEKGKVETFQENDGGLASGLKRATYSRFSAFVNQPVENISGNETLFNSCKKAAKSMGIEVKMASNNLQNMMDKGRGR